MPQRRIRSGVKLTISFLSRQITAAKKTIVECRTHIARLKRVDKRVRRLGSTTKKVVRRRPMKKQTMRGRGPNVREVAFAILTKSVNPMNITELAAKVIAKKGGMAGANFVQNLGATLNRDKRFKRVSRGVYGLK